MTPRLRIRRRRSSSRKGNAKATNPPGALAALATAFLLAIILATGPLILGAARFWAELPLFLAVAVLILIQGLRLTALPTPQAPRRADAIDLSVILFVVFALARWLTSPAEYFSRIEVMEVIASAAVFLTCRHGMANRRYCMGLLYVVVAVGIGETGLGFYLANHLDWFPFGSTENLQLLFAPRWMGTYDSPNHYAALLVMTISAGLALGSFSKLPWAVRIILFYVALMMIVGVMYSGSRGGWVALLAAIGGLVTMGIRNGTMKWWIPVSAAVVLLIVSGLLFSVSPVVQYRVADSELVLKRAKTDVHLPVQIARGALQIAGDHPLIGLGPGVGVFIHPRTDNGAFLARPVPLHNDYLTCLEDYGLLGYALAMFFIAAVTLKFFRPLWIDNRWQDRVLVASGFAAWLALIVHSLVDFNLHIPANALLLSALTGLGLGRIREDKAPHWSTLSLDSLGRLTGMALLILGLLYGSEVARTLVSENLYEKTRADEDVLAVSNSIQDADEALRYDSGNVADLVLLGDLHQFRASLEKDSALRQGERQKAIEAYQQALQANGPDDVVQARLTAARDLAQQDSAAH